MTAWGWKTSIHIYVKGEREPGSGVVEAAQAAAKVLREHGCEVTFAGASVGPVRDEPKDQVAT